jgi:hypothetical protein
MDGHLTTLLPCRDDSFQREDVAVLPELKDVEMLVEM